MTTSLQADSSHTGRRGLGPRVYKDSKDKQGRSHQRRDSHGEAKKRSDMKACHTMNQRSTNNKGIQMNKVWYRLQKMAERLMATTLSNREQLGRA
jgi:hypothetical protein